MMRIARFGLRRNGVRGQLVPVVQVLVPRHGDGVALAGVVVAQRRHAVLVEEAVAAVHALDQAGGVVAPVEQVRARHVAPVIRPPAEARVLEDVEQVVAAPPVDGAVGIERHGDALRRHEVVARPRRVREHAFAHPTCLLRIPIAYPGAAHGHAPPRAVGSPLQHETQRAAAGGRAQRHRIDGGGVAFHHHFRVVEIEALALVGGALRFLAKGRLNVRQRPAGLAVPLGRIKR